jgi:hypothetical protein
MPHDNMKNWFSIWIGEMLSSCEESNLFGVSENGLDDFPDMPYHTSSESPDKVKIT